MMTNAFVSNMSDMVLFYIKQRKIGFFFEILTILVPLFLFSLYLSHIILFFRIPGESRCAVLLVEGKLVTYSA